MRFNIVKLNNGLYAVRNNNGDYCDREVDRTHYLEHNVKRYCTCYTLWGAKRLRKKWNKMVNRPSLLEDPEIII